MSNQNNKEMDSNAAIGLAIIAVFCFFYKTIIAALKLMLLVGVVAAIIYGIYMLNKRTGFINTFFDRLANKVSKSNKPTHGNLHSGFQEEASLPPSMQQSVVPPRDEVVEQLNELKVQVTVMQSENERLKVEQQEATRNAVIQVEKENKAAILNDIFGGNNNVSIHTQYARSDEFEKQRIQENLRKKHEELEIRELRQSTSEHLFKQDVKIHEHKAETQQMWMDTNTRFLVVEKGLMQVEQKLMTLTVYFGEKFNQLEMAFFKEIATVKEDLYKFKADVSNQFADVRLQFGQEILRLDQQQVRIVEKVGSLHHTVKMFGSEMVQMRNEFDRGQIRAEELLSRASLSYEKQQLAIQSVSKDVNIGLQQMSLYKQDFANEVGSATLKLEKISTEQYFALKDVAYEKMGITMLRNEYDQRVTLEQTKMSNLIAEQRRVEERIQERISRGQEAFELKHQLHMTRENLQYSSNRFNLLQQEASVIRRQTK
jgi:hypothetical protein